MSGSYADILKWGFFPFPFFSLLSLLSFPSPQPTPFSSPLLPITFPSSFTFLYLPSLPLLSPPLNSRPFASLSLPLFVLQASTLTSPSPSLPFPRSGPLKSR